MKKYYLTKSQLHQRIETLNRWLFHNLEHYMAGIVKNESLYYIGLLEELEKLSLNRIENRCKTQLYQQLNII